MIQILLTAALLLAQDPKPAAKTVEERLKELDEKVAALEKKHQALMSENATLEKQAAAAKAMREEVVRQVAAGWVNRYSDPAGFTKPQAAQLETFWITWTREDQQKTPDAARWRQREQALKEALTTEQIPKLAGRIREEQLQSARMIVGMYTRNAQLDAERGSAVEKAALAKLSIPNDILLPQAHAWSSWEETCKALQAALPELNATLTADQQERLRKSLEAIRIR